MDRFAQRPNTLTPLVRQRWSPRAFTAQTVPADALARLFEAARWTPSCFNDQPWYFVYATKADPEAYDRLLGSLVEANQVWARQAPVIGYSIARSAFHHNNKPNGWAQYDTGAAMSQLTAQATAEGLAVHQMGGFNPEAARQALDLPDGYALGAAFVIGYEGDPATLPDGYREKELIASARRPIESFVFPGRWTGPR